MKQLFATFLLISLATTKVWAFDAIIDGICYNFSETEASVTEYTFHNGNGYWYQGSVVIPETVTYNGKTYSVTSIDGFAFYGARNLISIVIPNSVTSIGVGIFYDCDNLKSVVIGNGVTSIDKQLFPINHRLSSLTIGTGVRTISSDAFKASGISPANNPLKTIWLTNTPPDGYVHAAGEVNYVANDLYAELENKTVYPFLSSMFESGGVKYVPVSPSERTCDAIDCNYDETAEIVNIDKEVMYKGIVMTVLNVNKYVCEGNPFIKEV